MTISCDRLRVSRVNPVLNETIFLRKFYLLLLPNFLSYYQIKQGLTWLSNSFTSLKTQLSLELCFFMLRKTLVRPMTSCVPLNQITFRLANRDMIVFFMNTKTTKIPLKATKKMHGVQGQF